MTFSLFIGLLSFACSLCSLCERPGNEDEGVLDSDNVGSDQTVRHHRTSSDEQSGKAIADMALAMINQYEGRDRSDVPDIVEAMGSEGLTALLWSDEFGEALKEELQSSDMLDQVLTANLLTDVLGGRALVIGIHIPKLIGVKNHERATILSFKDTKEKGKNASSQLKGSQSIQVNKKATQIVDKLLQLMDVSAFLSNPLVMSIMKTFMQESPVLRRSCTPSVMNRIMEGMTITMELSSILFKPSISSKVKRISVAQDGESRTCLDGVSLESAKNYINPRVEDNGRSAFRVGMALKFAEALGKDGFRYMLQQIKADMVSFLSKSSGLLRAVMGAPVLNRILGGLVMDINVISGTGALSGAFIMGKITDSTATVNCVCKSFKECTSFSKKNIVDPLASIYNGLASIYDGERPHRCPASPGSAKPTFLPCCSKPDEEKAICVNGIGMVDEGAAGYKAQQSICREIGDGWKPGSRCMPGDPVLEKTGDRWIEANASWGIPPAVRDPASWPDLNAKAFVLGAKMSEFAIELLSPSTGSVNKTMLTALTFQIFGQKGFTQLLKEENLVVALNNELACGDLLGRALTRENMQDVLKGTVVKAWFPPVILPRVQPLTIDAFLEATDDKCESGKTAQLTHLQQHCASLSASTPDSLQSLSGRDLVNLLDADRLMGDDTFTVPLVRYLRDNGALLQAMHDQHAQIFKSVMVCRRIVMSGPFGIKVDSTITSLEQAGELEKGCRSLSQEEGGCPGYPVSVQCASEPGDNAMSGEEAEFVSDLRKAMISQLAKNLAEPGAAAMFSALQEPLLRAMNKGLLSKIMSTSFVRKLMVGFKIGVSVQGVPFSGLLPALPMCGVLPPA